MVCLSVYRFFQRFSGAEFRRFGGGNRQRFAGLRVTAFALGGLGNVKRAESDQCDLAAFGQLLLDCTDEGIHHFCRLSLAQVGFGNNSLY